MLPTRYLQSSELTSLLNFIQSGRQKRLVLVGEYAHFSQVYGWLNVILNNIAEFLGVGTRFSTDYAAAPDPGDTYDSGVDPTRLCEVNSGHYLMSGVTNMWDTMTSTFQPGWGGYSTALAYIHDDPTPGDPSDPNPPFIVAIDSENAGSIVLIHDQSVMRPEYNHDWDTFPNKNYKFIYNLCTIFPQ